MSEQRALTRRWLRQNIAAYSNQDIVYSHVDAVLTAHPNLRPRTDVYTFDDGRSQLMLCVHGLLPIIFRGASYNIPVSVWLPHAYPAESPLVYVVPTSDMLVRASKHVDLSGRCQFPYTQQWRSKSEACSLVALMDVLVEAFSSQPPVYAKPTSPTSTPPLTPNNVKATTATATITTSSSPPPPPPPPLGTRPSAQSPNPPPLPPHPNEHHRHYKSSSAYIHSSPAQDPPMYTTPPRPFTRSPPRSQSSTVPPTTPPRRPLQPYASPQPQPPPPPPPHPQSAQQHLYRPPPQPSHQLSYQQPFASYVSHQPPSSNPVVVSLSTARGVRNYLEEDIEDIPAPLPQAPPPPRPPNPEILKLYHNVLDKINSEYAAFEQSLITDLQRLRTAQSDLLAGQAAIYDEMGRLKAVNDVCRTVADRYQAVVFTTESNLQELRRKGDPEVDELICSTSIVYNQLIDLVAEDNAIEDTIYHLHRALNAGKLDLEKFLRMTRALAEEQFMKRALAQKIMSSTPMGSWNSQYT